MKKQSILLSGPVALLAASYSQVCHLVADYIASHDKTAAEKIFGLNAARFYSL